MSNVKKYGRSRQAKDENTYIILCRRYAIWMQGKYDKKRETHLFYLVTVAFLHQQGLHESPRILYYTNVHCLSWSRL